jgi:WD40 repeat protein
MFAPNGQTLIMVRDGGIIQVWDVAAGHERMRRRIHAENNRVALSRDGRFVACGGTDAMVRVWDLAPALTPGASTGSQPHRGATLREGTTD